MSAPLSEEDFAGLLVGFASHARAVRAQVDEYADALAAGDPVLRAQLRLIEEWLW